MSATNDIAAAAEDPRTSRYPTPTAGDMETAIHALHNILDAIWLVTYEQTCATEGRATEIRDGLLLAGKLITADFRRRF